MYNCKSKDAEIIKSVSVSLSPDFFLNIRIYIYVLLSLMHGLSQFVVILVFLFLRYKIYQKARAIIPDTISAVISIPFFVTFFFVGTFLRGLLLLSNRFLLICSNYMYI